MNSHEKVHLYDSRSLTVLCMNAPKAEFKTTQFADKVTCAACAHEKVNSLSHVLNLWLRRYDELREYK